jgi:HAL2 family 3'(2'),5'-bisphosphate nucleotidase
MLSSNLQEELQVAIRAVRKASEVCRGIRSARDCEDAISKKDRSPVTIADFGAQAVVIREVMEQFPEIPVVAEEETGQMETLKGSALGAAMVAAVAAVVPGADWEQIAHWVSKGGYGGGAKGRFWALDPIDGTKGFLRNEQYAVALALVEDGKPVLGVLGCPNYPTGGFEQAGGGKGVLFYASCGTGAWKLDLDAGEGAVPAPVRCEELTQVADARLCESVESGHSSHSRSGVIAGRLGLQRPALRMDSQCKYAAIATGDASIYLRLPTSADYQEKIWDHAAGWVVTTEAGAAVADVDGRSLDFALGRTLASNRGVVAAPKGILPQVLEAVRASVV